MRQSLRGRGGGGSERKLEGGGGGKNERKLEGGGRWVRLRVLVVWVG